MTDEININVFFSPNTTRGYTLELPNQFSWDILVGAFEKKFKLSYDSVIFKFKSNEDISPNNFINLYSSPTIIVSKFKYDSSEEDNEIDNEETLYEVSVEEKKVFQILLNHTNENLIPLPPEDPQDEKSELQYIVNMARKAKTHNARNFKFNIPQQQSKEEKQSKEKSNSKNKKSILHVNFTKKWVELLPKIKDVQDITSFTRMQEVILNQLKIHMGKDKNTAIEACREALGDILQITERKLYKKMSLILGNKELFNLLSIQHLSIKDLKSTPEFEVQIKQMKSIERCLELKADDRCVGFNPTKLQRDILDILDLNKSIIVRSPASTGKTMLASYLANKTVKSDKVTVYIAPNKPMCNEFSLFAYHNDIFPAIATEDFFSWEDIKEKKLTICTVDIMFKLICYGDSKWIDSIGSIIFDEFPTLMSRNLSKTSIILYLAAVKKWQSMILSATISDSMVDYARTVLNYGRSVEFIEPTESIRPTDLLLKSYHKNKMFSQIPIHTTYNDSLFKSSISTALRVPIALDEFKILFDSKYETIKSQDCQNNPIKVLPRSKPITGYDMTNFAVECEKFDSNIISNYDEKRLEKLKSDYFSEENNSVDPDEIYKMMEDAKKSGMLPIMFLHFNANVLEKLYHQIVKILERKYPLKEEIVYTENEYRKEEVRYEKRREPTLFGHMGIDELAYVFKNKSKQGKIKLGMRGSRVQNSEYYLGLNMGIGIHHHDIDAAVRDAVESGIRVGDLKVIFCQPSFAIGLNLPLKSIVFLDSPRNIEDTIQPLGRVGRWGVDTSGSFTFYSKDPISDLSMLWSPLQSLKRKFPLSFSTIFSLCVSSQYTRDFIFKWINYDIPQMCWNKQIAINEVSKRILYLQKTLELFDQSLRLTNGGKCALGLVDEGEMGIYAGYLISKFGTALCEMIKSKYDYLFLVSHFLSLRRQKVDDGLSLQEVYFDKLVNISPNLYEFMAVHNKPEPYISYNGTKLDIFAKYLLLPHEITAFYVQFPENSSAYFSESSARSHIRHFVSKMEKLHTFFPLPYDREAIDFFQNLTKYK